MPRKNTCIATRSRDAFRLFLWIGCVLFWFGAGFGYFCVKEPVSSTSIVSVFSDCSFTAREFGALLFGHLRWFISGVSFAVVPYGWFLLFGLIVFRGFCFSIGFISLFGAIDFSAFFFRLVLISIFECLPLIAFISCVLVQKGTLHFASDDAERTFLLVTCLSLFFALVCTFAELRLLPVFAFRIQLFT